jgi:hypothetical protein
MLFGFCSRRHLIDYIDNMKRPEINGVLAIVLAVLLMIGGIIAIATKRFPQGKGLYSAEPLHGNTAVLFGFILILIGFLMIRSIFGKMDK